MADTVEEIEAITDAAAGMPQQSTVTPTSTTVQNHPLPDLIALENHRANKEASRSSGIGVRFFNTRPHGAIPRRGVCE